MLLSPALCNGLSLDTSSGKIRYSHGEDEVASFYDFISQIQDTSSHEHMPYGSYLAIDKSHLEDFLNQNNMKLGIVIKQTVYIKDRLSRDERFKNVTRFEMAVFE